MPTYHITSNYPETASRPGAVVKDWGDIDAPDADSAKRKLAHRQYRRHDVAFDYFLENLRAVEQSKRA